MRVRIMFYRYQKVQNHYRNREFVYRSLFLVEDSINNEGTIEISEVSPEIMASLLEFAYTGQVSL